MISMSSNNSRGTGGPFLSVAQWLPKTFFSAFFMALLCVPVGMAQTVPNLRVAWDANNTEPDLAGYHVYWGPQSRTYTNRVTVGKVTTAEVPVLAPGATYYLAVTAFNTSGVESFFSNELTNRVPDLNNLPPTLDPIDNLFTVEDVGLQAVPLSGISAGGADNQPVTVSATSSDPSLIPSPFIIYNQGDQEGWLLFESAPNASGAATLSVTVDDGRPPNNTVTRNFAVTVGPINDPPAITAIPNQLLREDVAGTPFSFGVSDVESPARELVVTARSSNPALIPNQYVLVGGTGSGRVMMIVPQLDRSGTANITVEVRDPQGASSTVTFSAIVTAVNDEPLISSIADQVLDEDTASGNLTFQIFDAETHPAELSVFPVSSNQGLIPDESLIASGTGNSRTLSFIPVPNAYGSSLIQIWVMDSEGVWAETHFEVVVRPVNDVPVIFPITNRALSEDTPSAPISVNISDVETAAGDLILTATSSNPLVIADEGLAMGGTPNQRTLTINPKLNQFGVSVVRLVVTDLNGASATNSFTVGVGPVNDPPGIDPIPDLTLDEGSGPITVPLFGIHSGAANEVQTLSVSAVSSLPGIIPTPQVDYSSPNQFGSLLVTPVPNTNGTAVITVSVSDGSGPNSVTTRSFTVVVRVFNNPPLISSLPDLAVVRIPNPENIIFNVQDPDTPASNLTVTGYSSNQTLLPNANLVFSGTGISRTLTIHPVPGRVGLVQVTIVASDGDATVSSTFYVLVTATGV